MKIAVVMLLWRIVHELLWLLLLLTVHGSLVTAKLLLVVIGLMTAVWRRRLETLLMYLRLRHLPILLLLRRLISIWWCKLIGELLTGLLGRVDWRSLRSRVIRSTLSIHLNRIECWCTRVKIWLKLGSRNGHGARSILLPEIVRRVLGC